MQKVLIFLLSIGIISIFGCSNGTGNGNTDNNNGHEHADHDHADHMDDHGTSSSEETADQESTEKPTEPSEEAPKISEMEGTDLSEYDFPLVIKAPEGANVFLSPAGIVEVKSGSNFFLQIATAGNGIADKKADLESDLVYKVNYIKDEGNAIMYSLEIEGADLDPFYHFFVEVKVNGQIYEITDNPDMKFSKEQIETMYKVAKTVKPKQGA